MRTAPPNRCTGNCRRSISRRTERVDRLSNSATSGMAKNLSVPAAALPADMRACAAAGCRRAGLSGALTAASLHREVANEAKNFVTGDEAAAADLDRRQLVRAQEFVKKTAADAELLARALDRKEQRQLAHRG